MKSVTRAIFLFGLLILAFVLLASRCFYVQYFRNDHYKKVSVRQQKKLDWQKPRRGVIRDSRFRLLAASNKKYTIKAEPRIIKNPEEISQKLASHLDIEPIILYKTITESKNPGYARLLEGATRYQCAFASSFRGIGIDTGWKRYYPAGQLIAHIVGMTDTDGKGLAGIELEYEDKLRGSAASSVFLADARRRPVRLKESKGNLNDGFGIILTIDSTIQQFTRDALLERYKTFEAESAIAIVAEPKTGAILAMVSLPDYDPENRNNTPQHHFRNRAITDQFECGSIIKPIVAAIAVDAGVVSTTEKIFCENGLYHGKGFGAIREYRGHGYGNLTVSEILAHSSNVGMAKMGQKLGAKRLYRGLKAFGFGNKTGIDLPGEATGLVWPVSKWTGYSVTRIPYGHEITTTALQIVRAYCILANGGYAVKPYVVQGLIDSDGEVVKVKKPSPPVGCVIKPEVAKWMVEDALVEVVNDGTGHRAKLEKWQVFGKTGTADIVKENQRGYTNDNIASFAAGAPAEDPKIVVLVSIWKPNKALGKGSSGGAVASPVAATIIEKTLTYLEKTAR